MPKLNRGGVVIDDSPSGEALQLKSGSDYGPEEALAVSEDILDAATRDKKRIVVFAPGLTGKPTMRAVLDKDGSPKLFSTDHPDRAKRGKPIMANDGYTVKQLASAFETREPVLLVNTSGGFPKPYLALFVPRERTVNRAGRTAKTRRYARK